MIFTYDHNQSLGYLTGLASRLLSNTLAARFKKSDIDMTAEQWGVIILLLNCGVMTQTQLANKLYLEKSSVSRLTERLEKHGWIVRTKDPEDTRQKLIAPTPKVYKTAEHCAAIARTVLEEAQLGMTAQEMLMCRSILSKVIKNLRDLNG